MWPGSDLLACCIDFKIQLIMMPDLTFGYYNLVFSHSLGVIGEAYIERKSYNESLETYLSLILSCSEDKNEMIITNNSIGSVSRLTKDFLLV